MPLAPAASEKTASPIDITAGKELNPNASALNELRVDRQCQKVEEQFDIWQKAYDYAGKGAQLRLQVLVSSDFQHSQLSDSDRKLLRYLAYTTLWVPIELEQGIGRLYASFFKSGGDAVASGSGRTQRRALDRLSERLDEMRGAIPGFPGPAQLVLNTDLRDGAFARPGGLVVISPRFLGMMDEADGVRDVVLAHELSHLYKRHTVKELQLQLITSASGFVLAKKLLARNTPAAGGLRMPDFMFYAQASKEIYGWVQETQLVYSRDQELEADTCALNWLRPLGVEERDAWRTFGGVLADAPEPAAGYASLHPSPTERLTNIEMAMGRAPVGNRPPSATAPQKQQKPPKPPKPLNPPKP